MQKRHYANGMLTSLITFCLIVSFPIMSTAGERYKGREIPLDDILMKNMIELVRWASSGTSSHITDIIGKQRMENNNYKLFYCYVKSNGEVECNNNIILYSLDTDVWVLQTIRNKRWKIVKE